MISREDVAEVCIQSLWRLGARNTTFEIVGTDEPRASDWEALFSSWKRTKNPQIPYSLSRILLYLQGRENRGFPALSKRRNTNSCPSVARNTRVRPTESIISMIASSSRTVTEALSIPA